jgi:hypothetical protein
MVAWGLLAVALLADAASSIFELYVKFWWFDEALHFFSSFAITSVLALYAYGALSTGRRRHEVLLVLTITGLGVALGVLWEMIEWVFELVKPCDLIRKDGYDDRPCFGHSRRSVGRNSRPDNAQEGETPEAYSPVVSF